MDTSYSSKATPMTPIAWLAMVGVVVGLVALIFLGITSYLKQQSPQQLLNTNTNSSTPQGGFGQGDGGQGPLHGGGSMGSNGNGNACVGKPTLRLSIHGKIVRSCGRPTRGQVTAISSTSITVQPTDGAATQTFAINADTNISKDQGPASSSDIAVGDTVAVIVGDDASVAQDIVVEPGTPTIRPQFQ